MRSADAYFLLNWDSSCWYTVVVARCYCRL